jgi:hypothetical protein
LSATLDLATVQSASLGTEHVGAVTNEGAGYTVTDVGNLTGSGYDSFVIAAPGLTGPTTAPGSSPTFTGQSKVYIVFGSKAVNQTNAIDFLTLTPGQRAGDLGTLGQTLQVNPTVTQPASPSPTVYGFNYDGLTLVTNENSSGVGTNSGLGFSVKALGDINGDGYTDFAIGAPNDGTGGKAYIVYGGTALASQANTAKTIDIEPGGVTSTTFPTKLVSFSLATAGAQVGFSVGALQHFTTFTSANVEDVGIGAPGATNSSGVASGVAYAISGIGINGLASGTNVDLSTVGKSGGIGIQVDGNNAGDRFGSAIGTAGNFDGAVVNNINVDDLVVGAPGASGGAGAAYLIYGTQLTQNQLTLGTTINLSTLGLPATTTLLYPLQGVTFNGASSGSRLGYSLDSAGDYNGDGVGDLLLGAPGSGSATTSGPAGTGYAAIIYGLRGTSTSTPARINGIYTISPNSTNAAFSALYYTGQNPGDLAGFSVAPVGDISGEGVNGILIGAPGYNGGSGTAYVIPGNYALTGTQSLANVTTPTIAGTQLVISSSFPGSTPALGTSVSARALFLPTATLTTDSDAVPDVFVGAPGFSLTNPQNMSQASRTADGAGFYLSGASLQVGVPDNVILTQAGVGTDSRTGPFSIATTPNNLTIYVYSAPATNNLPAFAPFTDINQTSIKINGIAFPTLANFSSVPDPSGGSVPGASFVINRSLLNLVAGTTIPFTISGTTTTGTPFVATATVTITGGGNSGGGGGAGAGASIATIISAAALQPTTYNGPYGGQPIPPLSSLEHLDSYAPIPATIAYQQFVSQPGFLAREESYLHPGRGKVHQAPAGTELNVAPIGHSENRFAKKQTLPHGAFTRGKFKYGKTLTFTHKVKVIPTNLQTEHLQA